MKIMIVAGTRPEIVKLASTIKAIKKSKHKLVLVNTEQHKNLTRQVMQIFNITADYKLNIMKKNQPLSYILNSGITKLKKIIKKEKPDLMIVYGDTTTTLAGALSAFNNKIKLLHMEAGVRAPTKYEPFPEEGNRRMITPIADYNLCQSKQHLANIKKEGYDGVVVGNTGLDALKMLKLNKVEKKDQILITLHRRENWGKNIANVCAAIDSLADYFSDFTFIVSCHPNPIVKKAMMDLLPWHDNVKICNALPFDKFAKLMAQSKLIITDSGGIPQEAPTFKTPVFITRNICENQEILDLNLAKIVGTKEDNIFREVVDLFTKSGVYSKMTKEDNPCGNGKSYEKIMDFINFIGAVQNGKN